MSKHTARKRDADERYPLATVSSGNVFADLQLPDAEELQAKVGIAVALNQILEKLNMTQQEIAERIGTDQPKISAVCNYKLEGLSAERLMGFLTALGYDIDISIRPHSSAPSSAHQHRINVKLAA